MLKTKPTSILLGAAAGGLLLAAACGKSVENMEKQTAKDEAAKGQCHGINECKGKSDCHTATSTCAGQNSCKGKGWKRMSKADCEAQKGEFKAG